MLVRLYDLPDEKPSLPAGTTIRRPIAPERRIIVEWVRALFGDGWAGEAGVALAHVPARLYVAVADGAPVGFACFDATNLGFFGPVGVAESHRGKGIGKALLVVTLSAMREAGYAYAVIGGAGPGEFYQKTAGAVPIPGSSPGIYGDMLR